MCTPTEPQTTLSSPKPQRTNLLHPKKQNGGHSCLQEEQAVKAIWPGPVHPVRPGRSKYTFHPHAHRPMVPNWVAASLRALNRQHFENRHLVALHPRGASEATTKQKEAKLMTTMMPSMWNKKMRTRTISLKPFMSFWRTHHHHPASTIVAFSSQQFRRKRRGYWPSAVALVGSTGGPPTV